MLTNEKVNSWVAYSALVGISLITIFIFNIMSESVKNEGVFAAKVVSQENNAVEGAIIKTNLGTIEIEFYQNDAPMTVNNFIKLVESGFYNGTRFHRVIPSFMIQGGDPLSKDVSMRDQWGTGGPGYAFKDEIHANNLNNTGTIAMANAGSNTNGSQFFINVVDNNHLDTKHTVFGKVVKGMDVATRISQVTSNPINNQPFEDVVVESIVLK